MSGSAQRTSAFDPEVAAEMLSDTSLPMEPTEAVVQHYAPMVYRLALTRTQNRDDADDLFQEVFLRLLDNKKPFSSEEHRKAWLIRVCINCCNSHFVAPWRKNVVSLDEIGDIAQTMDSDERDIYSKVLQLPPQMKDVILLYYYEELSIREIAAAVDATEQTVKKRLSRARQRLKLELNEEERGDLDEGG